MLHKLADNSNNATEYLAFASILEWLQENGIKDSKITVHGDSKLVVEKMNGKWKIRRGHYVDFAAHCMVLLESQQKEKIQFVLMKIICRL
jgi:ribonuclease HI